MNLDITPKQLKQLVNQFLAELDSELLASVERMTIYLVARHKGGSQRAARMYALRTPPADRTSDQWWKGNEHFSKTMGEKYAEEVKALLAKRGVTMGPWDDYNPGSAKFKGDPDAVIAGHQGPRERLMRAQRLLAQRQQAIEDRPDVALAEDIIQDKFRAIAQENPEVLKASAKEKAKIRRQIIKKHAYRPERAGVEV
jgi:hypothetical protein